MLLIPTALLLALAVGVLFAYFLPAVPEPAPFTPDLDVAYGRALAAGKTRGGIR